jgi:outer membrane protein assembly factor BamB
MNTNYAGQDSCIIWKANTGRIHSKNCILVDNERVFVGTCGHHWNVDDDEDGVSLLNARTGELIWFTATRSDVNGICRAGKHLLCPTDRGDIFVVDTVHGRILSVFRLDSAALSRPVIWQYDADTWEAVAISAAGTFYWLSSISREMVKLGSIGEQVRADLVDVSSESERAFIVATQSGSLVRCVLDNRYVASRILCRVKYASYATASGEPGTEAIGLFHAAPSVQGSRLYIGFARNTYYPTAPLVCVDAVTGKEVWRASRLPAETCGNSRVTPLICGPYAACAFAHSSSLDVFDRESGTFVAGIKIGQHVHQHWSAPVQYGNHRALIGRVDGRLSIVDLNSRRLVASISLATRTIRIGPLDDAECDGIYPLYSRRPLGICGTPAVWGNRVFVGTTSGDLFALDLGAFGYGLQVPEAAGVPADGRSGEFTNQSVTPS